MRMSSTSAREKGARLRRGRFDKEANELAASTRVKSDNADNTRTNYFLRTVTCAPTNRYLSGSSDIVNEDMDDFVTNLELDMDFNGEKVYGM